MNTTTQATPPVKTVDQLEQEVIFLTHELQLLEERTEALNARLIQAMSDLMYAESK